MYNIQSKLQQFSFHLSHFFCTLCHSSIRISAFQEWCVLCPRGAEISYLYDKILHQLKKNATQNT